MFNRFSPAAHRFVQDSIESALDSATRASWGGGGYSVELFDDESYRVLDENQIGNLYQSPGVIISLRPLSPTEWDEDPDIRYYDNSIEAFWEAFKEKTEGYEPAVSAKIHDYEF